MQLSFMERCGLISPRGALGIRGAESAMLTEGDAKAAREEATLYRDVCCKGYSQVCRVQLRGQGRVQVGSGLSS